MESSSFEQILERDGVLVYKTRGISMRPMLRQERDVIVIKPPLTPPARYDVVLYRRGSDYVLHRVLRAKGDTYDIRGDNCLATDYDIKKEAILGVLTEFSRDGKKKVLPTDLSYRLYIYLWDIGGYPLRYVYWNCRRLAVKVIKRR